VPIEIPNYLKSSNEDYFSKPGEVRIIDKLHKH
jgi:hypothetical protein